ncbi:putative T7SS-secreted protein [Actinomycetota bacterium Odt1-20B]
MSGRPTDWHILDRDADPAPGDPARLRLLARTVRTIADDADTAARGVKSLSKDHGAMEWIGAAGDVFKEAVGDFPKQLKKVGDSHGQAADALDAYIKDLETAQSQADRALASGREVYEQVKSLRSQLSTARGTLSDLDKDADRPKPPDEDKVKEATRKHNAAKDRVSSLSGQLAGPEAQLEAAKKLAGQAATLRDTAAGTAEKKIREAADAGIPPDSFWDKLKDVAGKVWDGLVTIAKVVVAIGGIIALIVGGPIAWIVFAAALIVLADTLAKYAQGKASLWDVGLAALSCIPMTKGLTSLAALKGAWVEGAALGGSGLLGVGGHLAGVGLDALKAFGKAPLALWQGRGALPGLMKALPTTAWGKLTGMATDLRYGVPGGLTGFGAGFGEGSGVFGSFKSGFSGLADGWKGVTGASSPEAWRIANAWQGQGAYIGIDNWSNTVISAGTDMEALHPILTGFSMPEGTMAALGGDSAAISRGVQVGPADLDAGRNILHHYRPEGVTLRFNEDVGAATSHATANPQFGEGGLRQYYVPDVMEHVKAGNITVIDSGGNALGYEPWGMVHTGAPGQSIPLHNLDLTPGSPILTNGQTAGVVDAGNAIKNPVVGVNNISSVFRENGSGR